LHHFKNTCRLREGDEGKCEDDNDDEGEDRIDQCSEDFLAKRVIAFENSWNEICRKGIEHGGGDGHQYERGDFCGVPPPVFDEEIFGAEYCKNAGFYFHDAVEVARKNDMMHSVATFVRR
jgi:hypothetical protein